MRRHERQGFLGEHSEGVIHSAKLGIVGVNGGGSHEVQQFGHVGFRRFVIYDSDRADETNGNRNVLMTVTDGVQQTPKTELAKRRLHDLVDGELELDLHPCRWQEKPEPLRCCDLIFGCVDTFQERNELEACARRFLIPYIDIGLDVTVVPGEPPRMAGQVILSMPGAPCMRCLGFLTEERLAKEAANYGNAGPRPQVVWANGVLASTAVGLALDLLCDWTCRLRDVVYLSYDGNAGTVMTHRRLEYLDRRPCPHYPISEVGEPRFAGL